MPGFVSEKTIRLDEYYTNSSVNLIFAEDLFNVLNRKGEKLILTYPADIENRYKGFVREINRFCRCFNGKKDRPFRNLKIDIKPDNLITSEDLGSSSFLIFNTPPSKVFSDYIKSPFPIRLENDGILIEEDFYGGSNLQVSFTISNPFNPDGYLAFVMGTVDHPVPSFYLLIRGHYVVSRLPHTKDNILEEGYIQFDSKKPVRLKSRKKYQKERGWIVWTSRRHLFYVRLNSLAQKDIGSIVGLHELAYTKIVQSLRIKSTQEMFVCYLYETWKEENKGGYFSRLSNVIHAAYNEEEKWIYGGPHELTHAIMHRHWGNHQPPCWAEGIAMLLTWDDPRGLDWYAAESLYSNSLLTINDLLDDDVFKERYGGDAYFQAGSIVKFLVRRFGWSRTCEMMRRVCSGMEKEGTRTSQLSSMFESVYNISVEMFGKEWKSYIKSYLGDHLADIETSRSIRAAGRNIFRKRYPDALRDLKHSGNLLEKDPLRFYLEGKCLFLMGSLHIAAQRFFRVLQLPIISGKNGFVYRHGCLYLGKIYDLMGKRDDALRFYDSVLTYPEYDDAHDQARNLIMEPYKHDTDEKKTEKD